MKILVDADACPVKREICAVATERNLEVVLVANVNHQMNGYEGATVVVVGDYEDEADFRIVELAEPGDVVVTQDFGLAAMALGARARAISPRGQRFTHENMPRLLEMRHRAQAAMRRGRYPKPQKAFSEQDRRRFVQQLKALLTEL